MSCNKCHGMKVVRVDGEVVDCSCVKCSICKDDYRVMVLDEHGERRMRDCVCVETNLVPRYLEAAKIPKIYRHMQLSNFDVTSEIATPGHGDALFRAMEYANLSAEEMGGSGILFTGSVKGSGKTHLGKGTFEHVITTQRRQGLFVNCSELTKEIMESFDREDITAYQIRFPVLTWPIVLLDDLGAGHITPWVQEELASIIRTRHGNGLPTIITTNYPMADARADAFHADRFKGKRGGVVSEEDRTLGDCIGSRAYSRLFEMCTADRIVKMNFGDYRQRVKHKSPNSWR